MHDDRDAVVAKLLLVDDERKNLDVLIGILEPKGYDIAVALQGEAALDLVRQIMPDLVLLDVMMPGIDGYETCRRLKSDAAT
ncbi:MAG: response regulator, partial [Acidobacteria bacterium]|nr:response regulator [Acidobacteriota bacterium]